MIYLWVKALHIVAMTLWISGMLMESVAVRACLQADTGSRPRGASVALDSIRLWEARVTAPAMVITWMAGLTLARTGGWFGDGWLMAKLVVVVVLSVIHGILVGMLRRVVRGDRNNVVGSLQYIPLLVGICLAAIIVMVVLKP
jgi:putative membrane protein